jgi:transforming growth factor-beta-induced protein
VYFLQIITVDGSKVVLTDQNVTNGMIHVIDKVLYQLPKQNILQFGASNNDFSQLTYAVTKAKLEMSFGGII